MQRLVPLAVVLSAAMLSAQSLVPSVRIVRVPDVVALPPPAGANLLVEVEVAGAADAVWLANDAVSRDTVALESVGPLRFQANLADPRVQTLLPAGRDGGELFVFARKGATVERSPAIRWARTTTGNTPVYCLLRSKGGTSRTISAAGRTWIDPQTFESIEIQGAAERQSAVVARVGDLQVPLSRRAEQGLWVLDDGKLLREHADRGHSLEIEVHRGTGSAVFRCDLVPGRIELRDGPATFTVPQRTHVQVPGSHDWLTVHIDDITMGQVLLEVTAADGSVVVPQRSVIERDAIELPLAGERAVLTVDRLVNFLIGDDFAELTVRAAAGFQPDRIAQLIHAVAASKDTFVRDGADYAGTMAAQFLIARLGPKQRGITVDAFVDDVASRSSKTGAPYHVRGPDGTTVTMQEWLRAELRRLEASAPR